MDDSTRRAIAYHEAGHCVAGYSLGDRPLNEARAIMADPRHWRAVEALAEALLERKTIPGDEAHRIIAEAMEGD